jgi:tetraacyldisaccharide-1-P 4'-kinase
MFGTNRIDAINSEKEILSTEKDIAKCNNIISQFTNN